MLKAEITEPADYLMKKKKVEVQRMKTHWVE